MITQTAKYPLLPYSRRVWDILKEKPNTERYEATLSWDTNKVDTEIIKSAITRALLNHPMFSVEVNNEGCYIPGKTMDILHGQYHNVKIDEQNACARFTLNRILGDGESFQILLEDICRAYRGQELTADDFWGYLASICAHQETETYRQHQEMLESEFGAISYPLAPNYKTANLDDDNSNVSITLKEYKESINQFISDWKISLNGLMVLATAMSIMDENGTDEAGMTWAYRARETEQAQRIFGSLHRDVPIRIKRGSIAVMIQQTRTGIRKGIATSDYPYTLTSAIGSPWHKAVNISVEQGWEEKIAMLPDGIRLHIDKQCSSLTYLDVEINEDTLIVSFLYNKEAYQHSEICEFAKQVKKNIVKIIETKKD